MRLRADSDGLDGVWYGGDTLERDSFPVPFASRLVSRTRVKKVRHVRCKDTPDSKRRFIAFSVRSLYNRLHDLQGRLIYTSVSVVNTLVASRAWVL